MIISTDIKRHGGYQPLLLQLSRPSLHSVVAESRSQDLIFLVVRDLSNLATVRVLK